MSIFHFQPKAWRAWVRWQGHVHAGDISYAMSLCQQKKKSTSCTLDAGDTMMIISWGWDSLDGIHHRCTVLRPEHFAALRRSDRGSNLRRTVTCRPCRGLPTVQQIIPRLDQTATP